MLPRQIFLDHRADDRRTTQTTARENARDHLAGCILLKIDAQIMHLHGRAIFHRTIHRDLELARQPREFGVKGRPLTQDFGPRTRIDDFIGSHAGKLIGRDIADAIA